MSFESMEWVTELKSQYIAEESVIFLLHGNIHDKFLLQKGFVTEFVSLSEWLNHMLKDNKDYLLEYNLSDSFKFPVLPQDPKVDYQYLKGKFEVLKDIDISRFKAFKEMEGHLLDGKHKVGILLPYCETLVPNKPISSMIETDMRTLVRLLEWSKSSKLRGMDNIIILSTENIGLVNQRITSSSDISLIEIPLPTESFRLRFVESFLEKHSVNFEEGVTPTRFSTVCQGLTLVQIERILQRAENRKQIVNFDLVNERKKEILEQECLGLIEFVAPKHDFSQVGGMDRLKTRLMGIADNIKKGNAKLVPMGMLFVGPMGTGKTYLAEAFAKESGLTCIKLKNFRSKWVGSTDSNLDKVLQTVKALGNVILIIDEADRALQSGGNDPTNSRVIAKLKEFMSDTSHRGKILVVMMTNRPEKIDVDLKRAGRLDEKIPFFFPEDPETCLKIFQAQLRKHGVEVEEGFDWSAIQDGLVGYSAAEIEAVLLATGKIANIESGGVEIPINTDHVLKALVEVVRSRDTRMLEYMEMQAVFESSTREMLPDRYKDMSSDEIQTRLDDMRRNLRGRL